MIGCNGCTACCRGEMIPLLPDDDPSLYETVELGDILWLARDKKGNCIYLRDNGCSIYDHQPITCRKFDCGSYFSSKTPKERAELIRNSPRFKEIFKAGQKRAAAVRQENK